MGGYGSCNGHSGGPIVQFVSGDSSSEDHYVQIGIVQGGLGQCGDASIPAIFTRTENEEIFDFIQDQTRRRNLVFNNSELHDLYSESIYTSVLIGSKSALLGLDGTDYFNVNDRNNRRRETPLHAAIRKNHTDIAKYLVLNLKANVNLIDVLGVTPLHYAVVNGQIGMVKFLLNFTSINLIDEQDRDGKSLLWIASDGNQVEMVDLLLKRGANPDIMARLEGTVPIKCCS